MHTRLFRYFAPIFMLWLIAPSDASAQGYPGYPYTIMAPEHGGAAHHRVAAAKRTPHVRMRRLPGTSVSRRRAQRRTTIARGSSGSVLPAPLPRTALIPPEGGGTAALHVAPRERAPTVVPGIASPVPNLPHGTETFQDRASRCAFQQGLYNVPGNMSTQYMGACMQ